MVGHSRLVAGQNLLTVPVAAVSDRFERLHLQNSLRFLAHRGKLGVVAAIVGDLMHQDIPCWQKPFDPQTLVQALPDLVHDRQVQANTDP